MRVSKLFVFVLAALVILSGCQGMTSPDEADSFEAIGTSSGEVNPGTYIVQVKNGAAARFQSDVAAQGGTVSFYHEKTGFAVVNGLTVQTAAKLGKAASVSSLEADQVFTLEKPIRQEPELASVESPTNPATAYFFKRQWNMRAIEADKAWAAGYLGSDQVKVAILDTGIDYTYPDLAGRVDLSLSKSFVAKDDEYVATYFPTKHPITDLDLHGTHVAATVASNALVAAGVTSKVTLIGVKVCSVEGGCPGSSIIAGFLHAIDAGADVINMSLGGGFLKSDPKARGYVGFLNKTWNYAHAQGVTVVVSAGNEEIDLDHDGNLYKTYCSTPNTICVSATGPTASTGVNGPWDNIDALASYSNFGRSAINVAAPGGNDGGYIYAACSQTSLVFPICQTGNYVVGMAGTSMAAPHVSGLAALMVEKYGRNPGQIRAAIQQSADDLGQSGTDPAYGKGRINVARAVGL